MIVVCHDIPSGPCEILGAAFWSFELAGALHHGDLDAEGAGGGRAGAAKCAGQDVALITGRNIHVFSSICATYHRRS